MVHVTAACNGDDVLRPACGDVGDCLAAMVAFTPGGCISVLMQGSYAWVCSSAVIFLRHDQAHH